MKSVSLVILLLIGWVSAASVKEPCPPNESYTGCDIPCSALSKPYRVACRPIGISDKCMCKDGFYRTKEGTCVSMEQCPETQCPPGSSWSRCVTGCSKGPACDGAPCWGRHHGLCMPGCKCDEGLKVHPDGRCVKAEECPPLPTCPTNEVYSSCWGCTEEECGEFPVACAYGCLKKGCRCKSGFFRNGDGKCVKKEDCPKVMCGLNEVYKTCGSKCSEPKCKSPPGRLMICPAVCEQGCFCRKRFARDEAGACVYAGFHSCPGGASRE